MSRRMAIAAVLLAGTAAGAAIWRAQPPAQDAASINAPATAEAANAPAPGVQPSTPPAAVPEPLPDAGKAPPPAPPPARATADREPAARAARPALPHSAGPFIPAPSIETPAAPTAAPAPALSPAPPSAPEGSPPAPDVPRAVVAEDAIVRAEPEPADALAVEAVAVRRIVRQYERAFNGLDAAGAAAVWPSVDRRALERAFTSVARQELRFDDCSVALSGTDATVHCTGTVAYVPRVGRPSSQAAAHVWTIRLRGAGEAWEIVDVTAE